jgi:signal transduction histidine kinase
MPDGGGALTPDAVEDEALASDARLVQGVGRRLVAWAAGTTFVVLVILAIALYVSVSSTLEASGIHQLDLRASSLRHAVEGTGPGPGPRPGQDDLPTGYIFGGGSSGTFALIVDKEGTVLAPHDSNLPTGMPDISSIAAAVTSGQDVRLGTLAETPVRILTRPVESRIGIVYVQIYQDRTAEQRTLDALVAVLLVGGLVVVLVAIGFGTIYSRRALVPIRDSLTAQRGALRRQREFAADASHELRTPLTVIRASVDHLRRHRDEPVAKVGDALEDINAEVDHLTRLVDELLLLARSDSGAVSLEKLPVDLGDVAADAASSLSSPARDRDVTVEVDPEPAIVTGDAARLRQLVLILVDNAIAHSPPGGTVRVAVRRDSPSAALLVEDDGRGLRQEDLPRIFERFWRGAGAPPGGAGLGLAIASWIVDRHAGTIAAENRESGGARFTVRVPLAEGAGPG